MESSRETLPCVWRLRISSGYSRGLRGVLRDDARQVGQDRILKWLITGVLGREGEGVLCAIRGVLCYVNHDQGTQVLPDGKASFLVFNQGAAWIPSVLFLILIKF